MSDGGSARRGSAAGSPSDGEEQSEHVCPVTFCPIGFALGTVNRSSPEVVDHLLVAAREFLLAAKTLLDTRVGDTGGAATKLERIEIA
jgi:hypothetical protein